MCCLATCDPVNLVNTSELIEMFALFLGGDGKEIKCVDALNFG